MWPQRYSNPLLWLAGGIAVWLVLWSFLRRIREMPRLARFAIYAVLFGISGAVSYAISTSATVVDVTPR